MGESSPSTPDRRVVQCNYAEGTKIAAKGARAYVVYPNPGGGYDRIGILVRSRGARWVEKWERADRLCNFRVKTLPPEHPAVRQRPAVRRRVGRRPPGSNGCRTVTQAIRVVQLVVRQLSNRV